MNIRIGKYRHFKKSKSGEGQFCTVLGIAAHSETNDLLVIYRLLTTGNNELKARPIELFLEKVDKEKYPNCEQEYKFEYVG